MDFAIVREKLDQAVGILNEQGLDMWVTFVRESSLTPDPCLDLIVGLDVTWHSAFIITRQGDRVAIVGRFDAENVSAIGGYTRVISYDHSIQPALREVISQYDPQTIALNYSESDPAADGLTHGMYLYLRQALADLGYADRLTSAEALVGALRGRKSPTEIERIRSAIGTTEELLGELTRWLRPGMTEREIARQVHTMLQARGLGTAWEAAYCPVVNAGPDSPVGHAAPGDYQTRRGQLLHIDMGVRQEGFCSDLQRMWYFLEAGESRAPDDIQRAWDACWGAIDAAVEVLKPGVVGWQVDAAARAYLVNAGYPEYQHGLGHHVGRAVHDGATMLGPRWDRYGQTPYGIVEAGNVFTLELGTAVPGRGYIGLEEDVLVTPTGIEWLSTPQRELWLI